MTDPKQARCWDKNWKYVPKDATDVSKTWARARKAMKEAESVKPKKPESVVSIKRKSA